MSTKCNNNYVLANIYEITSQSHFHDQINSLLKREREKKAFTSKSDLLSSKLLELLFCGCLFSCSDKKCNGKAIISNISRKTCCLRNAMAVIKTIETWYLKVDRRRMSGFVLCV